MLSLIAKGLLISLLSIMGAHALTYTFIVILPDAAIIALGFDSAHREVLSSMQSVYQTKGYDVILNDLFHLNLGTTLDGIPVIQELKQAIAASLPRILWACTLIFMTLFMSALLTPVTGKCFHLSQSLSSFISFLPPYVVPFIGVLTVLHLQISGVHLNSNAINSVVVFSIVLVPGALLMAQTLKISQRNLNSDFARTLIALGASQNYLRWRLLNNLLAELMPSLEKMFAGMVSALLFAEPVLGVNGFGTMAVRAIRRSDMALILSVTLLTAVVISVLRMVSSLVRYHYGLRTG